MKRRMVIVSLWMVLLGCSAKPDGRINFTIKDLDGKSVDFAQYRGKTVILNIWATWCAPCKREIPDLVEIYNEKEKDGVVVLGVLLDSESPEASRPIVQQLKINYPVWYGDQAFAEQFNIQAFPTTIIVDKEGKTVKTMIGMQSKARFVNALNEVPLLKSDI